MQGSGRANTPPQDPRDLRIAQLEAALAATQAALDEALVRIAELERRLNLSSKNSSKPPSSNWTANRAARRTKKSTGKAQGGQKGHDGHHRSLLDESKVDHFIEHRPAICAGCGLELDDSCPDRPPLSEQTIELPARAPVVTAHRLLACRCSGCGKLTSKKQDIAQHELLSKCSQRSSELAVEKLAGKPELGLIHERLSSAGSHDGALACASSWKN